MAAAISAVCPLLCRTDAAPCATSASSLFLGRGGLLHSCGARFISYRRAYSAVDAIECASPARHGMAGARLACFWVLYASHTLRHVGAERIFITWAISAFAARGQFSDCLDHNRLSGALSGLFHAEFPGATRFAGCRVHLLGVGRLRRRL